MHLTRKAEARATALSLWLGVRTGGGGGGGGDTGAASGDATAPPPHDGATPDVSEPPDAPPSPFRVVPSSPHHAPPPPPGPPPAVALMEVDLDDDADIQDLEDLLETFFSNVDHTSNRLVVLAEHVANTESYVNSARRLLPRAATISDRSPSNHSHAARFVCNPFLFFPFHFPQLTSTASATRF